MKSGKTRVLIRYSLLQIPALLLFVLILILLQWMIEIPDSLVWLLIGCWVLKDVVLYPFVGRYYDPNLRSDWFSMAGKVGTVKVALRPKGKVQVKGELWKAELIDGTDAADIGEKIRVRGVAGLILLVESENTQRS